MGERIEPIPKADLEFARKALRARMVAALLRARSLAIREGGTDDQFAARLEITVAEFRKRILNPPDSGLDIISDLALALDSELEIGIVSFAALTRAKAEAAAETRRRA